MSVRGRGAGKGREVGEGTCECEENVLGNIFELHLHTEGLAGGGSELLSGCEHWS